MRYMGVCFAVFLGAVVGSDGRAPQPPVFRDWTQWGGPDRDFRVDGTTVLAAWPAAGPPILWRRPLGEGYSSIAAVGERLYTMTRRGSAEIVVALDAETGRTVWEHIYDAPPLEGMDLGQGPGPHATPAVDGGRVFTVGTTGVLHALDAGTGRVLWRHRLIEDLGASLVHRGYASSPLLWGGQLVIQTGGAGQAVMALDPADGRIIWRGGTFENAYSSPIAVPAGAATEIVALGAGEVIGLDARTGETRWVHPHPHRFRENIPTPVWGDGLLFVTSYADGGSRVLVPRLDGARTLIEELWHHTRLRVYYTNALRIGDRVYASSGDSGPTVYTSVDVRTGAVLWQSREIARASGVVVAGRLLLRDDEGRLLLVEPSDSGPSILGSASLVAAGPPTPPTVRGERVYIRDRHEVLALEVGRAAPGG